MRNQLVISIFVFLSLGIMSCTPQNEQVTLKPAAEKICNSDQEKPLYQPTPGIYFIINL